MKFKKLSLEETLFDDKFDLDYEDESVSNSDFDDDFSEDQIVPETAHDQLPVEGPKPGADTGVADLLMNAVNDEWSTIRQYNSVIATLEAEKVNNSAYERFIKVLQDITAEENKHIGQLQEVIKVIAPNASAIDVGAREGKDQLHITNMPKIQFWDDVKKENNNKPQCNEVPTDCTLVDVDDEM